MSILVTPEGIRAVHVVDQEKLALTIKRVPYLDKEGAPPMEVRGTYASITQDGTTLLVRTGKPEGEEWTELNEWRVTGPRTTGEVKIYCAPAQDSEQDLDSIVIENSRDVRVGVDGMRVGRVLVNRTINENYTRAPLSLLALADCAIGSFDAHLRGGGLRIDGTSFEEPGRVLSHGATLESKQPLLQSAGFQFTEVPIEACNEDCLAFLDEINDSRR